MAAPKKKRSLVRSLILVLVVVLASFYAMVLLVHRQQGAPPAVASGQGAPVEPSPASALHERLVDLESRTAQAWADLALARSQALRETDVGELSGATTINEPPESPPVPVALSNNPAFHAAQRAPPHPTENPALATALAAPVALGRVAAVAATASALGAGRGAPAVFASAPATSKAPSLSSVPLGPWRGKGMCGPNGIVAVTYATHGGRDDRFCRAVESAVRNKIPWEVLGWGLKWEGLSQKLQASLDYVRQLDPDCVMLFSDAFDVLFTQVTNRLSPASACQSPHMGCQCCVTLLTLRLPRLRCWAVGRVARRRCSGPCVDPRGIPGRWQAPSLRRRVRLLATGGVPTPR